MLGLLGAGCGSNRAAVSGTNTSNGNTNIQPSDTYSGGVPLPEMTPEGYKVYVSIEKEVCSSKEVAEVCKLAGSGFFSDSKGCGCLTTNKK